MKKYCTEYINEYTHFVVWLQRWEGFGVDYGIKIESGWHYKEDAQDQLEQIKELFEDTGKDDIIVKVLSRKYVTTRLHKDVRNDDNWESIPR